MCRGSVDGLIEFEYKNYFYCFIIEVDKTHQTSKRKLIDIYLSNHFQSQYEEIRHEKDIFPSVLIIKSDIKLMRYNKYFNDKFIVNFIEWDLNNIHEILE